MSTREELKVGSEVALNGEAKVTWILKGAASSVEAEIPLEVISNVDANVLLKIGAILRLKSMRTSHDVIKIEMSTG